MCCMLTTLVFFGPRLGILVWWLVRPAYVSSVLGDNWLFVLLLWAFLPWTVLMFLAIGGGPIVGFDCPLDTTKSPKDFGKDYPIMMYSISIMGRGPPYAYSLKECHDCTYRGGVTTKPDYWDD